MKKNIKNVFKLILIFVILASILLNFATNNYIYADDINYPDSSETDKSKAGTVQQEKRNGKYYVSIYDENGVKHYFEYSVKLISIGESQYCITDKDQDAFKSIYSKTNLDFEYNKWYSINETTMNNLPDTGEIQKNETDKVVEQGKIKVEKDGSVYFVWKDENGNEKKLKYEKTNNIKDVSTVEFGADTSDSELWKEAQEHGAPKTTDVNASDLPSSDVPTKDNVPIIDKLIDGAAGIILYPAKVVPLLIGKVLETAMGLFAKDGASLTLDEILFNKVDILSIDFFNINSGNSTINTIRKNVAIWYYGIRNIAAVLLFVILIYTGLKMALTTIAEEKAKYSEMIVDWLVGLALLFLLHYIMQLIIVANNQVVSIFASALTNDKGKTINMVDQFFIDAWTGWFTEGVGSAIAYVLLVGMTFVFLLSYLKRMITVAFLIVISPLVTVTYSIDKMGDNKSQALDNWFKEFCYNVLIQPLHCVAYLALVESAMKVLNNERTLAAVVVAFVMIVFLYEAEKIIKQIFNFNPQSMSDTVGHAAYYATIMGNAGSIASAGKNKFKSEGSVETKREKPKTNTTSNSSSSSANTRTSTSTSSGNASSRTAPKSSSRVSDAISSVTNNRLFQAGVTANKVASKMILGVGLAGATGDPTTMLSAGASAIKDGMNSGRNYREERNRHQLQQSYAAAEDEAKQNILDEKVKEKMNVDDLNNLTDEQKEQANSYREQIQQQEGDEIDRQAKEQVRNRANDLAGGADPETLAETRLSDSINKLKKSYKNNGMSDKNINQQLSNDFANIRDGKYQEATHMQVQAKDFAVKVKNVGETLASPVTDAKKYYRKKHNSQN